MNGWIVAAAVLAWPAAEAVSVYRRNRRQFWPGMARAGLFLIALALVFLAIAGTGLTGLGY